MAGARAGRTLLSVRRFPALVVVVSAVLLLLMAWIEARDAAQPVFRATPGRTVVFALPQDQARALPAGAQALGVYPESRSARRFLLEMGFGVPPRTPGRPARPDVLMKAWQRRGQTVSVFRAPGTDQLAAAALVLAAPGATPAGSLQEALAADVALVVAPDAASIRDAFEQVRTEGRRILVLGADDRTPVRVSASTARGVLTGGIARRAAIATPYDLAATLLLDEQDTVATVGAVMRVAPSDDADEQIDGLAKRLERGAAAELPLSLLVSVVGIALVCVGTTAMWTGPQQFGSRSGAAAAALPAAYMLVSVLPGPWQARAWLVPVAAFVAGSLPPQGRARRTGVLLVLTAFGCAVLAVVAAMFPDGPLAAGVWGNPLNSWRFFGMRNHLAAFAVGSAVAGLLMLNVRGPRAAAGLAFVGFVVGAAVFGANFVAVAILGVGATAALLTRRYGDVRARAVVYALLAGAAAFALALLLDVRAPVSHGGRALRAVGSDGLGAAMELLAARARLNEADISRFGTAGWVGFVGAIAAVAGLFDWASRTPVLPPHVRGAVAGGSLAAALAFVAEDSGFYTGAILGLFPWIVFILWRTLPAHEPLDPARAGEVTPPF